LGTASHSCGEVPKRPRAASPTPVACAERDASGRDHRLGEPVEIFEVDELAAPAAGDVLIDVVAAGIGNWDELVRIGSWQIGGPAPMALGTEAAGTVAASAPAWPSCARATR
jgi:Alcohol dehydrogenase GroES-like domain